MTRFHKQDDRFFQLWDDEPYYGRYYKTVEPADEEPRECAGGVLVNNEDRVLLVHPSGNWQGYAWTFPKGGVDADESHEEAARREVYEEAGYRAIVTRKIAGSFLGGRSVNSYFMMVPMERDHYGDWETGATCWATWDAAKALISETENKAGRERDLAVLEAARAMWEGEA